MVGLFTFNAKVPQKINDNFTKLYLHQKMPAMFAGLFVTKSMTIICKFQTLVFHVNMYNPILFKSSTPENPVKHGENGSYVITE